MAGSVLDNTRYRCLGCGFEVGREATEGNCPRCGEGSFEGNPTTVVCDFCSIPLAKVDEFFTHFAEEHALPTPEGQKPHVQDPEWAACGTCHRLIEAGDAEGLLDRAVEQHAELHPDVPRHLLRMAAAVPHTGFWMNIDVEREPVRGFPQEEQR